MVLVDALIAGRYPRPSWKRLRYAVLPAFVLALPSLAAIMRVNRAEMIEVMGVRLRHRRARARRLVLAGRSAGSR